MSFLPEINMSYAEPASDDESIVSDEEPAVEEAPEGITNVSDVQKNINKETLEEDPQFMYEDEDKIVQLKLSEKDLTMEDIFQPQTKPVVQEKLTKKGKPFKKRPPMSEEHKEKLKAARVKAIEVRQKKAAEKKASKALDNEEKELLKKQKVRKVQKLKEEVEEDIPAPLKEIKEIKETRKEVDVEKAVLEGITKYELIRKQRKKEKREQEAKEKEENLVRETLRRAVAPTPKAYNPYASCY
tara:strand:+ start:1124 stop:1849 length:726 start_codon:yes stop_codon:yes gene_type:complete